MTKFVIKQNDNIVERTVPKGRSKAIEFVADLLALTSYDKYLLNKEGFVEYSLRGEHFRIEIVK